MKKRPFTLVEMILVVAVIAILIALLLPSVKTVRDKGKQVTCMSNLRNMGQALVLYVADNDRFVTFSNWQSLDAHYEKGWLYAKAQRSLAEHVENGAFWNYLYERDIYHCPMHRDHETAGGTRRLTSYLMTGMMQHYSVNELFRYSDFPGDGFMIWEANTLGGSWNDGANFNTQASPQLSYRHFERANVLSFSGGVESLFSVEFDAERDTATTQDQTRLFYCPRKDGKH
ncbi:MAG: Tfp pilus assembly protein PilE [Rhodothermales bacterium]|jgi:Tfp pilus assembly protein PilE